MAAPPATAAHEEKLLFDFIQRYPGPACILLGCEKIDKPLIVRTQNVLFLPQHLSALQQLATLGQVADRDGGKTNGVAWTFTHLSVGKIVCTGTHAEAETAGSSSIDRQREHSNGSVELGASVARTVDGEAWFELWSSLAVPDTSKADFDAHLDLIRKIDFTATPLGAIDTWCSELLNSFTQCLASPFPVLMAWGCEDMTCLYNYPYSVSVGPSKHPYLLGTPLRAAFEETWDLLSGAVNGAFAGKSTYVKNGIIYLERLGYVEETYFSWAMVPIMKTDTKQVLGLWAPAFDVTSAVVTERRLKLLQDASQSFSYTSTPSEMYAQICKEVAKNRLDLPLLVFYDCDLIEGQEEESNFSSQERTMLESTNDNDGLSLQQEKPHPPRFDAMSSELQQPVEEQRLTFSRAAFTGSHSQSSLFPPEIDMAQEASATYSSPPSLTKPFQRVERTRRPVVLQGEDLQEYLPLIDRTDLGDALTCLVLLPILTMDHTLRAIVVTGLNPRKQYDDDYRVFLELFQAQISHGVASIRLVYEEIRRSRFFAALIKRKNEELHQLLDAKTEQLRASELRFLKMLEVNPAGICTADTNGDVTFVNEAWWKVTNHPREEHPNTWASGVLPEDLHIPQKAWTDALDVSQTVKPIEFRWKLRKGEDFYRWTWALISRELDSEGKLQSITGALIDHTEKKRMELLQKQQTEEAIETRRAQERFIDMTSHEMRNPLSAICLSSDASAERLELLRRKSDDTLQSATSSLTDLDETLADLKIISHCCTHMTRLIDDILTLSKLENEFLVITPVPSRPVDFLMETVSVFKSEMLAKDITCHFEITQAIADMGVDYVLTDPSRINQLVINLLTNAIKFTAESNVRSIKITLDSSTQRPQLAGVAGDFETIPHDPNVIRRPEALGTDAYLLISISDTGRGLTPEEISGLFQRFKQANPKTHISYGGSGLGLFICRRIAGLFGGEIGVESERGKGSTFTFYIPTRKCSLPISDHEDLPSPGLSKVTDPLAPYSLSEKASSSGTSHPQDESPRREVLPSLEKIVVLVVEDNLINQQLLQKHLTRIGCVVSCANHGQEAIDIINQSRWARPDGPRIDIVLMDIEMPVLDGISAIQHIRQLETSSALKGHIPVLAVSANARQAQIDNMIASGFDGTISKPFKIPAIMERMRLLLAEQASG